MEHTECKNCELSNGDCGYHFKMDGITNYEIASLSACDRYGNCEFFKPKAKPQGDLISREALRKTITNRLVSVTYNSDYTDGLQEGYLNAIEDIDNAPTVDLTKNQAYDKGFITAMKLYSEPKGEWIIVDDTEQFIAKCSVCGRIEDSRMVKYHPFCHCGADMRKGGGV